MGIWVVILLLVYIFSSLNIVISPFVLVITLFIFFDIFLVMAIANIDEGNK